MKILRLSVIILAFALAAPAPQSKADPTAAIAGGATAAAIFIGAVVVLNIAAFTSLSDPDGVQRQVSALPLTESGNLASLSVAEARRMGIHRSRALQVVADYNADRFSLNTLKNELAEQVIEGEIEDSPSAISARITQELINGRLDHLLPGTQELLAHVGREVVHANPDWLDPTSPAGAIFADSVRSGQLTIRF